MTRRRTTADRLLPGLLLFWAGLACGVGFLATPVKFLAPSLTLRMALDVGRQTLRAYTATEIVLLASALLMGVFATARLRWYAALAVPGAVVALQALWLLPALDRRLVALLAGAPEPGPSPLHGVYIGLEAVKVAVLLGFGVRLLHGPRRRDGWR